MMSTPRRVLVLLLTLAVLVLATMPAAAAQPRAFVSPQVALDWNLNAVNVVRAFRSPTTPPTAYFQIEGLIYMSYVQAAVYDAVTKISGRYRPYHSFSANTGGASVEAAVIAAAYRTLLHYQGDVVVGGTTLTAKYDAAIAALPVAGRAQGIAVGQLAAGDLIALRATDGRNGVGTNCPYVPQPVAAGVWQAPSNGAQTPWIACMKPFLLHNAAQFRIGPPPALESALYASDFNEAKAYGGAISTLRTDDQRATAFFWTLNVINQYNQALRDVATKHAMDLVDTVRLLAMGELVVADAGIACMDSKYHYLFWRPNASIPGAGTDNNPATVADPNWTPVGGATPNHPEYPSAHGCVTSAFAMVIAKALHTRQIDVAIPGAIEGLTATTTRTFATVSDVTRQIEDARVWIGFHYRFSDVRGVKLGTHVATWTLNRFFGPARGGNDDDDDDDNDNDGENED
jgi:hypothetical protein